jgi:excisionase family DNA binding protein
MKNLRFEDLPKAAESVLAKLAQIEMELHNIKTNFQPKEPIELMTRQEVADFFQISLVTVHDWTKKELLKSYRIGNRVRYKRSEIIENLEDRL